MVSKTYSALTQILIEEQLMDAVYSLFSVSVEAVTEHQYLFTFLIVLGSCFSYYIHLYMAVIFILYFIVRIVYWHAHVFDLYHSLDRFSWQQIGDIFLMFPRKQGLAFHSNSLGDNCTKNQRLFSGQTLKIISNLFCWNYYPSVMYKHFRSDELCCTISLPLNLIMSFDGESAKRDFVCIILLTGIIKVITWIRICADYR